MSSFKQLASKLLAVACLLLTSAIQADEGILDYHSDILVRANGSMLVSETILVRSEGKQIRRGIYRDFPTSYKDRFGNHYRVTFDVLDVQRNGKPEPFHIVSRSNGARVYMGDANRSLVHGQHEYRLRYHTTRQLGFFDNYDELYWNVTGSDWQFRIDRASATVELPAAVGEDELRLDFYTGHQGATGKDATASVTGDRKVKFQATRQLGPHENLTIAVGWPKGIVHEPTPNERLQYFLEDNAAALVLTAGILLALGWYLWAWNRIGRDPRKGVIIPLFEPPQGLTPAGCSYARSMSFGRSAFAAAVISLGVKGYLKIDETDDDFTLHRADGPFFEPASAGETGVLDALFDKGTRQHIKLEAENHEDFSKARSALQKALKAEHLGSVFNLNTVYALPALLLTIATAAVALIFDGGPLVWVAYGLLSIALHLVFLLLIRAPTPAGRRVMDKIEGFRMYLDTAEQDRLDRMRSPELTPEVFETFLPYAFALGVENNWCDRFAREVPADGSGTYRPHWYIGHNHGLAGLHHLGHGFNDSFSSAIASASTPPGSSSGSGGGGFSGGGGGGGGGGGW